MRNAQRQKTTNKKIKVTNDQNTYKSDVWLILFILSFKIQSNKKGHLSNLTIP